MPVKILTTLSEGFSGGKVASRSEDLGESAEDFGAGAVLEVVE